jgi:hypothetical protein
MNIQTDYDRQTNFALYKTFDWMPQPAKTTGIPAMQNPLLGNHIASAVERELTAKGFQKQSGKGADFLVAYHTGSKEKVDVNTWGYRYGPRGRRWGRAVDVQQYTEGTIILDFVDANSKELFWRSVAKGAVSGQNITAETVNDAVKGMLEDFPPK